jgi:hypothetical protein
MDRENGSFMSSSLSSALGWNDEKKLFTLEEIEPL